MRAELSINLLDPVVEECPYEAYPTLRDRIPAERLSMAHLAHIAPVSFRNYNINGKTYLSLDDYAWLSTQKLRKPG